MTVACGTMTTRAPVDLTTLNLSLPPPNVVHVEDRLLQFQLLPRFVRTPRMASTVVTTTVIGTSSAETCAAITTTTTSLLTCTAAPVEEAAPVATSTSLLGLNTLQRSPQLKAS